MLPYFYTEALTTNDVILNEDTSKHIIQVLRKKNGDAILLTDGKGTKATAIITDDNRKRCAVTIESKQTETPTKTNTTIAISLLKNASRFEWFLEKATEIGVSEIIPIICERTESEKFRHERLNGILISAMLQSQQCWLPLLHQPTSYTAIVKKVADSKLIAHCLETEKTSLQTALRNQLTTQRLNYSTSQLILIGPEGDFTNAEIEAALKNQFKPVTLGNTRLRTETAGLVAATLLCQFREDITP